MSDTEAHQGARGALSVVSLDEGAEGGAAAPVVSMSGVVIGAEGGGAPDEASGALPDGDARDRIVAERERNLSIIAGAGTGKTTAIVRRMVGMLAPCDDEVSAVPIERLAAITFTRRAAGELRFRLREMLLSELGRDALSARRASRLRSALSGLDMAFVGTIHAFADRLLRRRPTEARLSPSYELVEDMQPLVAETLRRLLRAGERDALGEALGAWGAELSPESLSEASLTVRAALRAGITLERRRTSWGELPSLESLLQRFIETRDAPPVVGVEEEVDLAGLERMGRDLARDLERLPACEETPGRRWLREVAERLQRVGRDVASAVGLVQEILTRKLWQGRHFHHDRAGHALYRRLLNRRGPWHARLSAPHRWLGGRLVRLAPIAVALYEQVRSERRVVDFLDVLVRLRGLLRDRPDIRLEFQGLFDHIFVDEFQDTDPLQCEIIFYLADQGARARCWEEIEVAPGRLTLVGDPQQSIYRFRRADMAMYVEAMGRLEASGARFEQLTTNFRSRPSLVSWFNQALPQLLGEKGRGGWDPSQGRVPYQPLQPSPSVSEFKPEQSVMILNYVGEGQSPLRPSEGRRVEAQAVALLIQNMVRPGSRMRIRDEETGEPRPVRPSDIAVLTESMTSVPLLLSALNELGLRSTVRGGRLLLDHPLIKDMLLGYCALCDTHDGVAEAALLRPPFFPLGEGAGLDLNDMAWEAAQESVAMLREGRAERSPGSLMRDLIERTGLTQALLLEVGGPELLSACYDVALELDRRSVSHQLDTGAAARLARSWASEPIPMVSPEPTGHDAIRVLTVYQAKGLEFPVVVLWDGFRGLKYTHEPDWLVSRDGSQWAMRLGDVVFEHPANCGLLKAERRLRSRERERLAYVAATRARDMLLLPLPERTFAKRDRNRVLAHAAPAQRLPYVQGEVPGWHRAGEGARLPPPVPDEELTMDITMRTLQRNVALTEASRAATSIYALSEVAAAQARDLAPEASFFRRVDLDDEGLETDEEDTFGAAVHAALSMLLTGRSSDPIDASHRSARAFEIPRLRLNIATHVQRSFSALVSRGLYPEADLLRSHVPLVLPQPEERRLLAGGVDLLLKQGQALWLIDFRTEPPPSHPSRLTHAYPEIILELNMASEALKSTGALTDGLQLHLAALFTRTGELIELP